MSCTLQLVHYKYSLKTNQRRQKVINCICFITCSFYMYLIDLEYFLVQFIEDNVKTIVTEGEIDFKDDTTCAKYLDKKYYPCIVLSESGKI